MITTTHSMLLAMGVALVLSGCGERHAPTTPSAKSGSTQTRGSRAAEYRAGLDAYTAGRRASALNHFRAAAEQGNMNAQYYTGLMYANGEGTEQNYHEAAKWYQKAAEHNHPDALFQLARLYVMGSGVEADASKAVELFGRAAQAFPPGEKRDQALQQKNALAAVVDSMQKPAGETAR